MLRHGRWQPTRGGKPPPRHGYPMVTRHEKLVESLEKVEFLASVAADDKLVLFLEDRATAGKPVDNQLGVQDSNVVSCIDVLQGIIRASAVRDDTRP